MSSAHDYSCRRCIYQIALIVYVLQCVFNLMHCLMKNDTNSLAVVLNAMNQQTGEHPIPIKAMFDSKTADTHVSMTVYY